MFGAEMCEAESVDVEGGINVDKLELCIYCSTFFLYLNVFRPRSGDYKTLFVGQSWSAVKRTRTNQPITINSPAKDASLL